MEHKRQSFHDEISSWKETNLDWTTHTLATASPNDPVHVRQRRQDVYRKLGQLGVMYLQRQLNVRRLPINPQRSHWEEFFLSEAMTIQQHARGQHVPFHEEMEHVLSSVCETLDSHLFGSRGSDNLAHVKNIIEDWFAIHVRQPGKGAWAATRQRKDARWQ